jgi:glycosyltransferase involved in cell wall biosynthesis
MNIAFIHPRWPGDEGTGATHSATQIVDGLIDRGHDVTIFCQQPDTGTELNRYRIHSLDPSGFPYHSPTQLNRELLSCESSLKEHDVVHSYIMPTLPAVAQVSNQGTPSIVTLNAYAAVCPKNDLRYLDHRACTSNGVLKCIRCSSQTSVGSGGRTAAYRTAGRLWNLRIVRRIQRCHDAIDGYHALSPHVKRTYDEFGFDASTIRVVPNILDPAFETPHRSAFTEPYRLLYVGSLGHRKGVDRLPRLVGTLRDQSVDVTLTVVGTGELRDRLADRISTAGLADAIDLRGHVPYERLPGVYADHDLFVYPGRWDEPFGRVFLEAMSAGTPVVSTDVGSVAEIVGNAGAVTDQSVSALADGVRSTLDEQTLARKSRAGKERLNRYRSPAVIPQFEALYERVRGKAD